MAAERGTELSTEAGRLSKRQYVRLARAISSPDMESIALGYLNTEEETVKNLRYEHRGNAEAFNRDILMRWAYQNPGSDQVQVKIFLPHIFFACFMAIMNPH